MISDQSLPKNAFDSIGQGLDKPYFPFRFAAQNCEMEISMAQLPEGVFDLPFYNDGVEKYFFESPMNRVQIIKNIDLCLDLESLPQKEPSGFMFHMSRCGSTLASQLLSCLDQHRVVSEATVISHYLASCKQGEVVYDKNHFQWLVKSFGQLKNGIQSNYFIKFNSWNVLFLETILEAFPDVPWIFIGRNPIEIMVSNYNKPTAPILWQLKHNPLAQSLLKEAPDNLFDLPIEEYFGLFLAEFLKTAMKFLPNGGKFVDYKELCNSAPSILDAHFNLSMSHDEFQKMKNRARYNAKSNEKELFKDDSEEKIRLASIQMEQAVEKLVMPYWNKILVNSELI